MNNISYKEKYLKYKEKYLSLRNQIGSAAMTARQRMKAIRKKREEFKLGFLLDSYREGQYLLFLDSSNHIGKSSAIIGMKNNGSHWEYETNNSIYYSLNQAIEGEVKLEEILKEKGERERRRKLIDRGRAGTGGPP